MADKGSSSKSTRGYTKLNELNKLRLEGRKLMIPLDDDGQIIPGPETHKLMSYMGSLVRSYVPITYTQWKEVDKQLKDQLWDELNIYFDNISGLRNVLMKSMGESWRSWKSKLFVTYVKDVDLEHRYNVPVMYNFITPEDWRIFVDHRTTPESMEKSKINTERAKAQKTFHTTSRMGYSGLQKKMVEQGATAPISRAELWKAGHKRKTGEFINKDAAELASKIDEFSSQESQSAESSGRESRNDILSTVLGKEHPGRVRAGGKFSTIKSYFKNDRRDRSVARIEDVEAIVQERLSQQQQAWNQQQQSWNQQQELWAKDKQAQQEEMNNMKNQIEQLMRMISAGTGTHMSTSVALAPPHESFAAFSQPEPVGSNEPETLHGSLSSPITNGSMVMLPNFITMMEKENKSISLVFDPEVFGSAESTTTFFEITELYDFLNMERIGVNIILACIGYIESQLKKYTYKRSVYFHNPTAIFAIDDKYAKQHSKTRALDLKRRLSQLQVDSLLFLPYHRLEHWMLAILDYTNNTIYWLDPLNADIRDDIKNVITSAIKDLAKDRHINFLKPKVLRWKPCPKQPDNIQCGYYIMCYVIDIVDALKSLHLPSMIYDGVTQFSQEKIDTIRNMICDYIMTNCDT